jgi:hypothetical protein
LELSKIRNKEKSKSASPCASDSWEVGAGKLTNNWGLPRAVSLMAVIPVPYVAPASKGDVTF